MFKSISQLRKTERIKQTHKDAFWEEEGPTKEQLKRWNNAQNHPNQTNLNKFDKNESRNKKLIEKI